MSSVSTIAIIVIMLALLVCYAFISQTIHNKRELRKRLVAALKSRARTFKYILESFPQGFLSRDMTLLVQRTLADTLEQLIKLEPREQVNIVNLQEVSRQMSATLQEPSVTQPQPLESPQKIREVRLLLEELHRFVYKMELKGSLTRNQADAYRNELKRLILRTTVDSYMLNGRIAQENSKIRLAIHYFELTIDLLFREGLTQTYAETVENLREQITRLQTLADLEAKAEQPTEQELAEQAEIANEWNEFTEKDNQWKKKRIYD